MSTPKVGRLECFECLLESLEDMYGLVRTYLIRVGSMVKQLISFVIIQTTTVED